MEATGVYWRPVFHALCEAEAPLEVLLVNARHVKNVPGRKSDLDAVWLAELTECGLLRGSFIPPREIAAIRELTRYRALCRGPDYSERQGERAGQQRLRRVSGRHNPGL
jgi:transposase